MPIDATRPLSTGKIRQLLVLSEQLKRDPSLEIAEYVFADNPQGVLRAYRQLAQRGYILPFDETNEREIPRNVELTEEGTSLTADAPEKSFTDALAKWVTIIAPIAQIAIAVAGLLQ